MSGIRSSFASLSVLAPFRVSRCKKSVERVSLTHTRRARSTHHSRDTRETASPASTVVQCAPLAPRCPPWPCRVLSRGCVGHQPSHAYVSRCGSTYDNDGHRRVPHEPSTPTRHVNTHPAPLHPVLACHAWMGATHVLPSTRTRHTMTYRVYKMNSLLWVSNAPGRARASSAVRRVPVLMLASLHATLCMPSACPPPSHMPIMLPIMLSPPFLMDRLSQSLRVLSSLPLLLRSHHPLAYLPARSLPHAACLCALACLASGVPRRLCTSPRRICPLCVRVCLDPS